MEMVCLDIHSIGAVEVPIWIYERQGTQFISINQH